MLSILATIGRFSLTTLGSAPHGIGLFCLLALPAIPLLFLPISPVPKVLLGVPLALALIGVIAYFTDRFISRYRAKPTYRDELIAGALSIAPVVILGLLMWVMATFPSAFAGGGRFRPCRDAVVAPECWRASWEKPLEKPLRLLERPAIKPSDRALPAVIFPALPDGWRNPEHRPEEPNRTWDPVR